MLSFGETGCRPEAPPDESRSHSRNGGLPLTGPSRFIAATAVAPTAGIIIFLIRVTLKE